MLGLSRQSGAKVISGLVVCGLLTGAFGISDSIASSVSWEVCIPISQNPVFGPANGNVWDNEDVSTPFVVFNGSYYNMWYTSYSDSGSNVSGIGFAYSPDGITWTRYPSPVLMHSVGGWDSGNVFEPDVVWNGTSYLMYYSATNTTSISSSIGLATSADGMHWQKNAANPILTPGPGVYDRLWVKYASVIFDGVSYKMWYSGRSASTTGLYPRVIGFANSSDGIHWKKYAGNPVLVENGPVWYFVQHSSVVKSSGGYLMAMSEDGHSIRYATSKDGLTWEKGQTPLINNTVGGTGVERDADYPSLLVGPFDLRLYYTQFNSSLVGQPIPIRIEMANCPISLLPVATQSTITKTQTTTTESAVTSYAIATQTVTATVSATVTLTTKVPLTSADLVPGIRNDILVLSVALTLSAIVISIALIRVAGKRP
jgi:predicted GH43/DUF377 family glycosyl hydrolase